MNTETYMLDLINDPIEELYMWEHILFKEDVETGIKRHLALLECVSLAIVARQALSDTVSCYSEPTEHALHPEAA